MKRYHLQGACPCIGASGVAAGAECCPPASSPPNWPGSGQSPCPCCRAPGTRRVTWTSAAEWTPPVSPLSGLRKIQEKSTMKAIVCGVALYLWLPPGGRCWSTIFHSGRPAHSAQREYVAARLRNSSALWRTAQTKNNLMHCQGINLIPCRQINLKTSEVVLLLSYISL